MVTAQRRCRLAVDIQAAAVYGLCQRGEDSADVVRTCCAQSSKGWVVSIRAVAFAMHSCEEELGQVGEHDTFLLCWLNLRGTTARDACTGASGMHVAPLPLLCARDVGECVQARGAPLQRWVVTGVAVCQ